MSDKKDDEKKDDEEKEEEPEEEEEEEEDDDDSSDDEDELDEDLFDIETGEPFGEMEQSWSMIHFNDKKLCCDGQTHGCCDGHRVTRRGMVSPGRTAGLFLLASLK